MNFDDIKGRAMDVAGVAAQKAKKLASITKANVSIGLEREKIRKAQTELGKLYYRDYVLNEEMDDAEYLPWCDKITESRAVIDELQELIQKIRESDETVCTVTVEPEEDDIFVEEEAPQEEPAQE